MVQVELVEKLCPPKVQEITKKYVFRSSYFAHPELILITLLSSEDEEERRFGVKIIKEKIRGGAELGVSLPRKFDAPPVNFQAKVLTELIDWDTVPLTEPLITATLTSEQVISCLDTPLEVPSTWQCHSQSMERAIRKVSESCLMVVGEKKREGWIRCAEASRKVIKKPNTKADYLPLFDFPLD